MPLHWLGACCAFGLSLHLFGFVPSIPHSYKPSIILQWPHTTLNQLSGFVRCPNYLEYSQNKHPPYSGGQLQLPSQRPLQGCRTFRIPEVEGELAEISSTIVDPDLAQLFRNTWPNTLDTAIKWHGFAQDDPSKELTFIVTGDIDALWLRDSANQLQSYVDLLRPSSSKDSLAALYRGLINLQSRYILSNPFCNAFNPPPESKLKPSYKNAKDIIFPPCDKNTVFECKFELDSLAAFLQVSNDYFVKTQDAQFFAKYDWMQTIRLIIETARRLQVGTYADDGSVQEIPYCFRRMDESATETQANHGRGNPVTGHTGLVRSFFRPSDDSTIYQLFIPANVMFAYHLEKASAIAEALKTTEGDSLAKSMQTLASKIQKAIDQYGVVYEHGHQYYAYEIDGYGGINQMDDANIPSLLSLPFFGIERTSKVYQNTRARVFSSSNPYWNRGPIFEGIGGPHVSFGSAWPMSLIVQGLTSDNDDEIRHVLRLLVNSTAGLGLIHESLDTHDASKWTRPWFAWANGLFGQLIRTCAHERPQLLRERLFE